MSDNVLSPAHYTRGSIECVDAIREALGEEAFTAYVRGSVIKYVWRSGLKGSGDEDLRKASWYLNFLLNRDKAG